MILRKLLVSLVSLTIAAQPVLADTSFYFRYKPGYVQKVSDRENPSENFDVTARFVGVVGQPFDSTVPTKPGKTAARWSITRGSLPAGLSLNEDTGRITGTPSGPTGKRSLVLDSFGPTGTWDTKASVIIEILAARPGSTPIEFYAHSGKPFRHHIPWTDGSVYSWTPAVELPSWARVSSASLEGTAPEQGTWSVAFTGKDHSGNETAFVFGHLTVEDGPKVEPIQDRLVKTGTSLIVSGAVKRSVGQIRWEHQGDPLLPGLSFDGNRGQIQGNVPTFGTTATYRLKAIDADGTTGYSNEFTVGTLPADLEFSKVPTIYMAVNEPQDIGFSAAEVSGEPSWSISSGSLPDGISFDPVAGRLKGIPEKPGEWSGLTVTLSTSEGDTQESNTFKIVVAPDTMSASVPETQVRIGAPFSTPEPAVKGGLAPHSFRLAEGSVLPEGASFDPDTGVVAGTAQQTGNLSVALAPVDATGRLGNPFVIGISAFGMPAASMDKTVYDGVRLNAITAIMPTVEPYSLIPEARWSLTPATLPQGLAFDSAVGRISGTPTVHGTFGPYTMTATDGTGAEATTEAFSIQIADVPPMEIETSDIDVQRSVGISVRIATAVNGVGTATFALHPDSAPLPAGLRLSADGILQGVTSATEAHPGIVVTATDTEGRTAISQPFTLRMVQPGEMTAVNVTHKWAEGVAFATPAIKVSNAAPGLVFEASAGLPAWISLDAANGSLAGTAPAAGQYGPYQVKATDSLGRTATAQVTLDVVPPLSVSVDSTHTANRLAPITPIVPVAVNAVGATEWFMSGSLPQGLSFDGGSGQVTGIPLQEGSWNVTFTARDQAGQSRSAPSVIQVGPRNPLDIAYVIPELLLGRSTGLPILPNEPTNAAGKVAFRLQGEIPPGLSFNASTGAFSGSPTQAGVWEGVTVSGTDEEGSTAASDPLLFRVTLPGAVNVSSLVTRTVRIGSAFTTAPVAVSNVLAPLAFSTPSGSALAFPGGISMNASTGSLSGIMADKGTWTQRLRVTDKLGRSADFDLRLDAVGNLMVAFADIKTSLYGQVSAIPSVTDRVGTVNFSLAGTLPEGLSFDTATGKISGTALDEGTFGPFTLTATDSGTTANDSFMIEVGPRKPIQVGFVKQVNDALANQAFALTPTLSGAVGKVTWTHVSGTLPPGLSFEAASGQIKGTPTALGEWGGIVVSAADSAGGSDQTEAVTIRVKSSTAPIALTTAPLTTKAGLPFVTAKPTVQNEVGDYIFMSPQAESLGLVFDPLEGTMSGSFASVGKRIIDLSVTDMSNRVTSEPQTVDVLPNLRLTMPATLYVMVNKAMTASRPVTEYAVGSVAYELVDGLPAGLAFTKSTGAISGTTTEQGLFESLVITGTDSLGDRQSSAPFVIEVVDDGSIPLIATPTIPILRAGTAMTAVTPSVQYKKTGDVYSLNKPLPDGLSFNSATGAISGTPAPGSHGIHEGYVMSVADVNGRGTQSEPFTLSIRHQLTPSYANVAMDVRANIPFTTPAITVTNPQAFIGTPKFEISAGSSGLAIDPVTGSISGTVTSTRSVTVRVRDDLGYLGSNVTVTLTVTTLSVTLTAQSVAAGADISYFPQSRAVFGPDTEWTLSSRAVQPQGLAMNRNTGEITGKMPFGTYFLKAQVSDNGQTAISPTGTSYVTWRGTSDAPTSLLFAPLENQEHGTLVVSEILPVTGITGTKLAYLTDKIGFEFRVCYDPECVEERRTWSNANASVDNGEFIQARASVPLGDREPASTSFNIDSRIVGSWTVTSSARDDVVPASSVFPVSATRSGVDFPIWALYDGNNGATAPIPASLGEFILDFGRPVSFSEFYVYKARTGSTDGSSLYIETSMGWQVVHSSGYNGEFGFGRTVTAQRVKLTGSNNFLYELRIGGGPARAGPVLNYAADATVATLGDQPQSIALDVTANPDVYGEKYPLKFSIVGGQLPAGGTLDEDGTLHLPSASATGPGGWEFTVRVEDRLGFNSQKRLLVFAESKPASTVLAATMSAYALNGDVRGLYDGNLTLWNMRTTAATPAVVTFSEPVTFNSVYLAQTSTDVFRIEVEVGGQWVSATNNGSQKSGGVPLFQKFTANRIRVVSSGIDITEFRVGNGLAHAAPALSYPDDATVATLGSDSQSFPLAVIANPDSYGDPYPLKFSIVSGQLPTGGTLDEDGTLHLPSSASTGAGGWEFTVRVEDRHGFNSQKRLLIFSEGTAASSLMPSSTSGVATNAQNVIYDGSVSTNVYLSSPLIVEFSEPVTFDVIYFAQATDYHHTVSVEVGGTWITAYTGSFRTGNLSLGRRFTASRLRIASKTSSVRLGEFRVGAGPAQSPP